ncbi:MAG: DUF6462 family protein [Clostridiales bacterium]|nr:DUF6462 family protein [Clostridiales bacterium]
MNYRQFRNEYADLITVEETMQRTNYGRQMVMRLAREAGALVKVGRTVRIKSRVFFEHLDEYLVKGE